VKVFEIDSRELGIT